VRICGYLGICVCKYRYVYTHSQYVYVRVNHTHSQYICVWVNTHLVSLKPPRVMFLQPYGSRYGLLSSGCPSAHKAALARLQAGQVPYSIIAGMHATDQHTCLCLAHCYTKQSTDHTNSDVRI
jgi:hypothetical protein